MYIIFIFFKNEVAEQSVLQILSQSFVFGIDGLTEVTGLRGVSRVAVSVIFLNLEFCKNKIRLSDKILNFHKDLVPFQA